MTSRLFISLEIPIENVRHLVNNLRAFFTSEDNFRIEKPEKMHITLKFLGDTDNKMIPYLQNVINEIGHDVFSFESSFSHFGFFGHPNNPRILWIGLKNEEKIKTVAKKLEKKLEVQGFEAEKRPFNAHLTISRLRGTENDEKIKLINNLQLPAENFMLRKVSLFNSELSQRGSIYSKIHEIELKQE